jgi:hypothetical protein
MRSGDAQIGHQAVELPPVRSGGVQAEQVTAATNVLVIDVIGPAARNHGYIATGHRRRRRRGVEGRMQRGRCRRDVAECQPFADFKHPTDHVAVLQEGKLIAAHGEFRHAGQHGEDRVMVPGRHQGEELRQTERGAARVNWGTPPRAILPSAKENVVLAPSLSTAKPTDQGPRHAARTASSAQASHQSAGLGQVLMPGRSRAARPGGTLHRCPPARTDAGAAW